MDSPNGGSPKSDAEPKSAEASLLVAPSKDGNTGPGQRHKKPGNESLRTQLLTEVLNAPNTSRLLNGDSMTSRSRQLGSATSCLQLETPLEKTPLHKVSQQFCKTVPCQRKTAPSQRFNKTAPSLKLDTATLDPCPSENQRQQAEDIVLIAKELNVDADVLDSVNERCYQLQQECEDTEKSIDSLTLLTTQPENVSPVAFIEPKCVKDVDIAKSEKRTIDNFLARDMQFDELDSLTDTIKRSRSYVELHNYFIPAKNGCPKDRKRPKVLHPLVAYLDDHVLQTADGVSALVQNFLSTKKLPIRRRRSLVCFDGPDPTSTGMRIRRSPVARGRLSSTVAYVRMTTERTRISGAKGGFLLPPISHEKSLPHSRTTIV